MSDESIEIGQGMRIHYKDNTSVMHNGKWKNDIAHIWILEGEKSKLMLRVTKHGAIKIEPNPDTDAPPSQGVRDTAEDGELDTIECPLCKGFLLGLDNCGICNGTGKTLAPDINGRSHVVQCACQKDKPSAPKPVTSDMEGS